MRGASSVRAGVVYHFISQFVAKEWFVASTVERHGYLSLLADAIPRTDWRCFAYAVMSSHIHLALVAGMMPLAEWMAPMHSRFATWINQRRERVGGVFVRGPEVIAFSRNGVAQLINYIHCNPVRAGVVSRPHDSDWTSHRAYVGQARRPHWLDVDLGLQLAGFRDGASFDSWVDSKRIERAELEALRLEPRARRGRPRGGASGAQRIKARASRSA